MRQVPLAFMDLFKFYPSLKNAMPLTNENVRTAFVVIFIPIRIVYWPYICSEFWQGEPCRIGGAAAAAAAAVAGGGGGSGGGGGGGGGGGSSSSSRAVAAAAAAASSSRKAAAQSSEKKVRT